MFRLFNRYILTNMTPSESYDMTLTWTGQGVNYQTRVKTFEVHMYPSEVIITQVDAFAHRIEISFETSGNFSVSFFPIMRTTKMELNFPRMHNYTLKIFLKTISLLENMLFF